MVIFHSYVSLPEGIYIYYDAKLPVHDIHNSTFLASGVLFVLSFNRRLTLDVTKATNLCCMRFKWNISYQPYLYHDIIVIHIIIRVRYIYTTDYIYIYTYIIFHWYTVYTWYTSPCLYHMWTHEIPSSKETPPRERLGEIMGTTEHRQENLGFCLGKHKKTEVLTSSWTFIFWGDVIQVFLEKYGSKACKHIRIVVVENKVQVRWPLSALFIAGSDWKTRRVWESPTIVYTVQCTDMCE